ncbi:MAG: gamma-glutamylcyclotransferase family protein [Propylenella sp.]
MIYFAYGSNMDPAQMRERCGGSRARGVGFLADYRLGFPRWSPRRGYAVASIEACSGASVWGVLYDMTAEDWTALHPYEGHIREGHADNRYDLIRVDVLCDAVAVAARAYIAVPDPSRREPGPTSARYLKQLIDGATAHGLPADYIAMLRAVPTFD